MGSANHAFLVPDPAAVGRVAGEGYDLRDAAWIAGDTMFASIRKYEDVGNVDVIELAAKEQFFPLFEKLPGFVSHAVVDTGDNTVMSVTIFKTREQAEAGNLAVRDLVRQILSHAIPNPATIVVGRVMAHLDR